MTDGRHPISEPSPTAGEALPCLVCGKEAVWVSPTGHWFCQECRDLYTDLYNPQDGLQPVDLTALMSGERPEEDWCVAPVLPAGKLVGIVSKRGEGKSLLLLDMAAARACGLPTLSQPAGEPIDVIYVDMEMGPDDLYERLADLGYLSEHPRFRELVDHLHYYQLVALPPLDTEAGGVALEELVDRHNAQLVIIDTVSRVISGNENDADPFRELFRHTETRLKRRRVTLARLDHLGKDKERGSRGSSAKEDPLDVVWHLTETLTGAIELSLTKGRQGWIPRSVTIYKEELKDGTFSHVIPRTDPADWLVELVERIDLLGVPVDMGVNKTLDILRAAGQGAHRRKVSQAVRFRRSRLGGSARAGTTQSDLFGTTTGTTLEPLTETLINIDQTAEPPTGTSIERVVPGVFPPIRGNHPGTDSDLEDFEPSLDDLQDLEALPDPW